MTSFLLDTNAFIWAMTRPEKLGKRTHANLVDQQNNVYVSALSVLEIQLKIRTGKLKEVPLEQIYQVLKDNNIQELPYDFWAGLAIAKLPALSWNDPFDAALMAQAMAKHLTLVTPDHNILTSNITGLKTVDARK